MGGPKSARFVAVPIAGLYGDAYPFHLPVLKSNFPALSSDFTPDGWRKLYDLYKARVDSVCSQDSNWWSSEPWRCLLPNVTVQTFSSSDIKVPVFAVEALSDSAQLVGHNGVKPSWVRKRNPDVMKYVKDFSKNMSISLNTAFDRDSSSSSSMPSGFFAPACYLHTEFSHLGGPWIHKQSWMDALTEWWKATDAGAKPISEVDISSRIREDGVNVPVLEGDCGGAVPMSLDHTTETEEIFE